MPGHDVYMNACTRQEIVQSLYFVKADIMLFKGGLDRHQISNNPEPKRCLLILLFHLQYTFQLHKGAHLKSISFKSYAKIDWRSGFVITTLTCRCQGFHETFQTGEKKNVHFDSLVWCEVATERLSVRTFARPRKGRELPANVSICSPHWPSQGRHVYKLFMEAIV